MKKINRVSIIAGFTFLFVSVCFSQTKKDTLRVLFVGNSYTFTENLPQIVSLLSDSTHTKLITKKSVVGGATLREHWYSERGLKSRELIAKGGYDVVVLQENSMGTINFPDSTLKYIKLFSDLIKSKGAKPCLYVTWARKRVPQYQDQITKIYLQAATENKIAFVPAGPAWELARNIRPDVPLHGPDEHHQSSLGTFLNACIFTAVLTGEIPKTTRQGYGTTDLYGESIQLMYLDALDIVFCLKVTEQILKDYKITK